MVEKVGYRTQDDPHAVIARDVAEVQQMLILVTGFMVMVKNSCLACSRTLVLRVVPTRWAEEMIEISADAAKLHERIQALGNEISGE